MKQLRFIGVALLTVLMSVSFSACSSSDDDDNGGSSSNPLVGTWYIEGEEKGYSKYTEFTFEDDMTFTWRDYTESKLIDYDEGTYRIVNDLLYTTWKKYSAPPRKFKIEGNKLITDEAGGTTCTKK